MLTLFARGLNRLSSSRGKMSVGMGLGLTSVLIIASAGSVKDATALGETRSLTLHHTHSGEDLTVTFKRNGRYDEDGLRQLNHHLRDWRSQDKTTMDRRLFDILWEVYRDVGATKPINIISAYRSPATNAMLRRRSSGVARHSQHMLGHAMDFYIPGVSLEQIRFAGLRLQRGGVGFYPTSGSPFVHLDTGSIRHWPRMNADQLARVFPSGRTVHVPSNGRPLAGYELALADIEKRGDGDDSASARKPSILASLLKSGGRTDEDDESPVAAIPTKPNAASVMVSATDRAASAVPSPRSRPAARMQLASADMAQLPTVRAAAAADIPRPPRGVGDDQPARFQTPADIINSRGFWDDMSAPRQATPQQVAAITARQAISQVAEGPEQGADTSYHTLAFAPPASSPVDRANIVAASAPVPRVARPTSAARNTMTVNAVTTVLGKSSSRGTPLPGGIKLTGRDSDVWLRAMMLAPSTWTTLSATVMGDGDMTAMRAHFTKPNAIVATSFGDDPQFGMLHGGFAGTAVARLQTVSFVTRTAGLR